MPERFSSLDEQADDKADEQMLAEWFMPDENGPHKRTWMAYGASQRIWGRWLLPEVQRNLGTIARTIAEYEPVSMLVNGSCAYAVHMKETVIRSFFSFIVLI